MGNNNINVNGCKDLGKVKWRRRRRKMRAGRHASALQMKVKKLQTLIPGGQGMQADRLLLKTADYILHLKLQLHVLQALSKFYSP